MDDEREQSVSPLMKNGDLDMPPEYVKPRRKRPFLKRVYKRCSDAGLIRVSTWLLVTIGISIFGAFCYRQIEWDVDEQRRQEVFDKGVTELSYRNGNMSILIDALEEIKTRNLPEYLRQFAIMAEIESYEQTLPGIDLNPPEMSPPGWTFQNSMFFCCSLYNSIGFGGRLFPETTSGKVVTMIYSFVGIPLMLAMTSDLGLVVFNCVYWFWWKWRQMLMLRPGATEDRRRRLKEAENVELMKKQETTFPVFGGIFMSIVSLAFCSGVCMLIEPEWTYFDANYYYVTSFLTIGLGDISPSAPNNCPPEMGEDCEWTLLPHTILLIFCMTFIGCIQHVMSRRIELVYAYIENAIHMHFRNKSEGTEKPDDEDEEEYEGDEDEDQQASVQIGKLAAKLGMGNRFYYAMMDQSRARLLQEIWHRKTNMKNANNQAFAPKRDVGCQHLSPVDDEFDIDTYGDYVPPEYFPKPKHDENIKLVKYVYNVHD